MIDISKVEENLKVHHIATRKVAAQLEQQSKSVAQAIEQIRANSATARLNQMLADIERSSAIPSAAEQLRRTTAQLPDFVRIQNELAASFRISQEAREYIENLCLFNRTAIDKFSTQAAQQIKNIGVVGVKPSINAAIKKLEADRAISEQFASQIDKLSRSYKDFQPPRVDIKLPSVGILRQLNTDFKVPTLDFSDFHSAAQTAVERFAAQAMQSQRAITAVMEQLRTISHLPELLEISPDGSVTLEGESASALEVNEAVEGLFSLIHEPDFFDNLWERLKEFKYPIQAVALCILGYILVICLSITSNILTPYVQSYLDQFSFSSRREVTQAIKKLPYEFNLDGFVAFRVVTGDRLRLRENPSMKSRILDELKRGKLVRVIEKRRNWTLVEVVYDDSDEPLQGWVATRYIAILRR